MRTTLLLAISWALFVTQSNAQLVLTDGIDLGEDRVSHNYQEYNPAGGGSIKVGPYQCSGDSAINIGANNQYDSITFNLSVRPNVDEIVLRWSYSWFNAGPNKNEFTKVVIEDTFEEPLSSPAPNAIGSHPVACALDSHMIVISNMAAYTADSSIKIKIYDPFPGFEGNASICRMNVYTDNAGVGLHENKALSNGFKAYPNPFTNSLAIRPTFDMKQQVSLQIVDILGKNHSVAHTKNDKGVFDLNTEKLPKGLYFVFVKNASSEKVLWSQKLLKE